MKKYAILIAAIAFIQQAARADHMKNEISYCWPESGFKADSSVRGAMHVYSTQHMRLPADASSVTIYEESMGDSQSDIRADSSRRGARMPQEYWDTRPSSGESYSSDLEFHQTPAVITENPDEVIVEPPAVGAPSETPDTGNATSQEFNSDVQVRPDVDVEHDLEFDSSSGLDRSQNSKALDIQSDIDSDAHPDISTQSQLDRSSADSDLRSSSPEQGAPAVTPDSGSDRSSLQSEATLQQSERTDLNSDESKSSSDYRSERSQSDLNAPANDTQLRQENSVDSGNAPSTSSDQSKSSEFKSDTSSSAAVDTSIKPNLTYDATKDGSSDLSLSEKIRTGLTTGSEGRPAAFNSTMLQDVKIDSHAGLITLRGKVSSDQEKRDIEARVKEMPGVTSVNNMLEVSSGSDSTGPEIK